MGSWDRRSGKGRGQPVYVTHLITDLDRGGAEIALVKLLEKLDPARIINTVISLSSKGSLVEQITRGGVRVFELGVAKSRLNVGALLRLLRLLRRPRPDVLQTWLYHADFAGLLAGKLTRVPVVWNIRCAELDPRDHPPSLMTLLHALALASRYPATVICNSHAGQRAHEQLGYAPRKWAIIPNGFDTDAFRPCPAACADLRRELTVPDDARLVGLFARFHPMKDHATFLQAAKIVTTARPDVHVVAAGRGVDVASSLNSLVDELALRGRVHLLPERRDAPRFLAALDVAVSS